MSKLNPKYNRTIPRGLETIDVYRVLKAFDVTDPCIQHAIKKLLAPGVRGVKTEYQDVNEAMQSLARYQHMRKEEDEQGTGVPLSTYRSTLINIDADEPSNNDE